MTTAEMASSSSGPSGITMERLTDASANTFQLPSKRIHDGDDLTFFLSSTAYRDLMTWLLQLNSSMFPRRESDGKILDVRLDAPPLYSESVQSLRDLVKDLSDLIEKAPPDTGPRRFGNVAFKTWHRLVEESADAILDEHLTSLFEVFKGDEKVQMREELKFYLLESLGSAQRLDYGTGHELSFLAFLGCLWKLGAFAEREEAAIVIGIVQP